MKLSPIEINYLQHPLSYDLRRRQRRLPFAVHGFAPSPAVPAFPPPSWGRAAALASEFSY